MMIGTTSKVKVMIMTNTVRRYMTTTMMPIHNGGMTSIRPIIQMTNPIATHTRQFSSKTDNAVPEECYYHDHLVTDHLEYVDDTINKTFTLSNKSKNHQLRNLSTSTKKNTKDEKENNVVPDEEYYHGHLMADHLEYLDDMIEKTVRMNESVQELRQTYDKKKQHIYENVNWMTSNDINELFNISKEQKIKLQKQLHELNNLYENSKLKMDITNMVGVDAPDGTSDDLIKQDLDAVKHIIDYAQAHENKYVIHNIHDKEEKARADALRTIAVDAPDGTPDADRQEEINEMRRR